MDEAPLGECKYSTWYWLEVNTGETRPFKCGSWSCQQHAPALAYHWAVRIAQARPERMITLTNIPKDKKRAYLGFQQLLRDIRGSGRAFEYVRFLEVGQRSGMYHFHLAHWGAYIPVRSLSKRALANGMGKIVDIRACRGQGPAFYMAKYITKETGPPGWRKVATSRGWPRPSPSKSEEDWELVRN